MTKNSSPDSNSNSDKNHHHQQQQQHQDFSTQTQPTQNIQDEDKYKVFDYCRSGDLRQFTALLDTNKNYVNITEPEDRAGSRGSTLLHIAAGFGRQTIVHYLLNKGAKCNAKDKGGLAPLHNASCYGHVEIVKILIEHNRVGLMPIEGLEVVDLNSADRWDFTPLHEAAFKNREECVHLLLQYGADFRLENSEAKMMLNGSYRFEEMLEACRNDDSDKIKMLVTPINVNLKSTLSREISCLHLAAGYNRILIIDILLNYGADVNAKDEGGLTPLHNAASYGHTEAVKVLLSHGAKVNSEDNWAFTPLHEAASKGREEVSFILLDHLANPNHKNVHGKSVFDVCNSPNLRTSLELDFRAICLRSAIQQENLHQVKLNLTSCVSTKAELDLLLWKNPQTDTSLLQVAQIHSPTILEYMIGRIKELDSQVKEENMVKNMQKHQNHQNQVLPRLNLQKQQLFSEDSDGIGGSPLVSPQVRQAAKQLLKSSRNQLIAPPTTPNVNINSGMLCGVMGSVTKVINNCGIRGVLTPLGRKRAEGSDNNMKTDNLREPSPETVEIEFDTPEAQLEMKLLKAAKSGNLEEMKNLIKGLPSNAVQVMINCRDLQGRGSTPLHFAAGYNRVDIMKFLISKGAEVNMKDNGGLVPLHNACSYGHVDMVRILMKNGANINEPDHWKFTPLHEAAMKHKTQIIKLLISEDVCITSKTCDDLTPLDLLNQSHPDYQYLEDMLRGDTAVLELAKNGETQRLKSILSEKNVNCVDYNGRLSSALHLAAGYNQLDTADLLLKNKARVDLVDRGGLIALHNAASFGHTEMVQLLLTHESNVNAKDKWLFTPLHEAAQKGRTQVCGLLLAYGADPHSETRDGLKPIDLVNQEDLRILLKDAMDRELIENRRESQKSGFSSSKLSSSIQTGFSSISSKKIKNPRPLNDYEYDNINDPFEIVKDFLRSINLMECAAVLQHEKITMEILKDMDHESLIDLGISAYGDRHLIIKHAGDYNQNGTVLRLLNMLPNECLQSVSSNSRTKLYNLPSVDRDYQMVYNHMIHSIATHRDMSAGGVYSSFSILRIDRILNKKLWSRYCQRKAEIAEEISFDLGSEVAGSKNVVNEELLWHGSPALHSIVKRGFDERHAFMGGMFGAGIYFAENSSKSNQYVYGINGGNGCRLHNDRSCYSCERQILLCQVALGRQFEQFNSMKVAHAPPGHHSLSGKPSPDGLMFAEHVIYRGEQAYPTFLVTYKITN